MGLPWLPQNPGIDLNQLTEAEILAVESIAALGDPDADRILFWDDSAGGFRYLTAGTGLQISGTTLSLTGGAAIDGSGTANEIAYWVDSDTLGTLAVATYPSLTELSRVKGVTSAIQTQLDAKQATLVSATNIKTINGSSILGAGDLVVSAGTPTAITVANEATDATCFIGFFTAATGDLAPKTNTGLTYNSSTNALGATTFTGALVGNASTATALANARTIGGVSFDGTGNITVATATGGFTISGGNLALTTNSITMTGSIGATGARVTKGWFTDIESTNMPTVGGVAILTSLTAPQFTTIELGHASQNTLSASGGVLSIEGVAVLTTTTGLALTGGTMTGNITLGENASIALDPAGSADGKYTGITVTAVAGYTQAFGDLVYLAVADSRWELADADAVSTSGTVMLAMVVSAGTDGTACTLLLQGIIRADAKFPALTVGAPVYVGETAGAIQVAIPTGADNVIRVVGFALTADEIYFNPSVDHQTTVA